MSEEPLHMRTGHILETPVWEDDNYKGHSPRTAKATKGVIIIDDHEEGDANDEVEVSTDLKPRKKRKGRPTGSKSKKEQRSHKEQEELQLFSRGRPGCCQIQDLAEQERSKSKGSKLSQDVCKINLKKYNVARTQARCFWGQLPCDLQIYLACVLNVRNRRVSGMDEEIEARIVMKVYRKRAG